MFKSLFTAAALLFCGAGAAQAASGDCAGLTKLNIPNVSIARATLVTAGAAVSTGATAPPLTFDIDFCRVNAWAAPTSDSKIGIEVWLPVKEKWNGKYLQVGNGGYAGAINPRSLAAGLKRGYAVAATDDGNQMGGNGITAAWALGHPEKIVDFAWRAVNQTTLASKTIILNYEGAPAKLAYFMGCSTGGREAMLSAQRFPLSFDGIVAGAPAAPMVGLLGGGAIVERHMTAPGAWIPPVKLPALQKAALAACAKGKSYIADPERCKFDPAKIACHGKETDACLTRAQVISARMIYKGAIEPGAKRVLHGQMPGAEGLKGSWDTWIIGTAPSVAGKASQEEFARNFYASMVTGNPAYKVEDVTDADIVKGRAQYGDLIDAQNPDLSAYKARGGKLIQYHGWNDPAIAAKYSTAYFTDAQRTMGDTSDFYRLFMVPGMLHCRGGDAPTDVDWLPILEEWVEHGKAPDTVTAKGAGSETQTLTRRKS